MAKQDDSSRNWRPKLGGRWLVEGAPDNELPPRA